MSANESFIKSSTERIDVVGLVLYSQSTQRVAVFRRGPEDSGAGHWEFPGGKVDPGESNEQALSREISEELSIVISASALNFISKIEYQYPTKKIQLFLYLAQVTHEDINFCLTDHDRYQWVTISELKSVDLSPADLALVPEVQKILKSL